MVVVTGLEPRRRGLRIFRAVVVKSITLRLSLTPPLLLFPEKLRFSGTPLPEVTGSAPVKNKNKQGRHNCLPCFLVVVTGLEPVTSRTSSGCATSCAKRPCVLLRVVLYIMICPLVNRKFENILFLYGKAQIIVIKYKMSYYVIF